VKKQFFYILFFFGLSVPITAQTDSFSKSEVGFNLGFLVTNLLRNETLPNRLEDRNFMLSYKKRSLKNTYFRYGISFFYNKSLLPGSSDDRKTTRAAFRIGYEYKFAFSKKWTINRGTDVVAKYLTFNQSFTEEKTRPVQVGLVPFLGIQYNINPKINLSTESGIGFFYVNNKNLLVPGVFSVDVVDGTGGRFTIFTPRELILSISF